MKRRYYVDYLKALGCITIVALHVIGEGYLRATAEDDYCLLRCMQTLTRWAVPVFVMVSGCNLLGRENSYLVAKKHIRKMLITTCLWGIIYTYVTPFIDVLFGKRIDPLIFKLNPIFAGEGFHLWFCFMIIGLYMLIPIVDPIIKDKRRCECFILVCLFGEIILPIARNLGEYVPVLETVVNHLRFPQFGLFIVYFVLGYYIDRYAEFTKNMRCVIYCTALLSAGLLVVREYLSVMQANAVMILDMLYEMLLINYAIGILVFFKFDVKVGKVYPVIRKISEVSFGIFLMHVYLYIRLSWVGINASMFNPMLAVPTITLLIVAACFAASCIVRKIPIVGKWLF